MSNEINLDKVTGDFIKTLSSKGNKPLYELQPDEARQFLLDIQNKSPIKISAEIFDTYIPAKNYGNIEVRFVRPKNSNNDILPVILYLHGGGWVMGDKITHDMLIRKLANCTNSAVAFVNYSRAPEAKYPVAINETYEVLEYLYNHNIDFNINPDKIILAGDSAGGNMAAVCAIKAKNENGPKILFQILLYPVTNIEMNTESYNKFKDGPWLTKKAMEWFWQAYLPDKTVENDIYISPLQAKTENLQGLPPALIITAENDVLRDEGEEYASRLIQAGVDVLSVRINNTHHDFMMLNDLANSPGAKGAFSIVCNSINKILIESD